jgi:hypothetical protein
LDITAGIILDTLENFVLPEVVPFPPCFRELVPTMGAVVEVAHSPETAGAQALLVSKLSKTWAMDKEEKMGAQIRVNNKAKLLIKILLR